MSVLNRQINIREIVKGKAPSLSERVPSFLFTLLEKIICLKEINRILLMVDYTDPVVAANQILDDMNVTYTIVGDAAIPDGHRILFVSNHPLGALDGIVMISYLGKKYNGKVKMLVNDLLLHLQCFDKVFLPINKHGGQNREVAERMNRAYDSDLPLFTFPAGLVSRYTNGSITDPEWKGNFIKKTVEYEREIVPIFFEGRNPLFFYTIACVRKFFGIKANIEMLFLPRAMFGSKNRHFTVHVGTPIPHQTFDTSRSQRQWTDWVRGLVYSKAKK